jgi:hypothetical protein
MQGDGQEVDCVVRCVGLKCVTTYNMFFIIVLLMRNIIMDVQVGEGGWRGGKRRGQSMCRCCVEGSPRVTRDGGLLPWLAFWLVSRAEGLCL